MPEPESKSMPEVANELWGLTKDYARQETIDPLKGVGRYLAYGAAGALLGSLGVILLMLACCGPCRPRPATRSTATGRGPRT